MHPSRRRTVQGVAKRLADLAGATIGLAVSAPILGAAAAAVWLQDGRPIVFTQDRAGADGRPFRLYKLRTMLVATHAADGRPLTDGERITRLGRLLRASSVDELPQLWNILRGDMSLVGPRPLHLRYIPRYSAEQRRRLDVRPGLTGWAQVNGRNALGWPEKLALDVWYVDHWSLALDARIVAKTVGRVVRADGISSEGHATMAEFMGESLTAAVPA